LSHAGQVPQLKQRLASWLQAISSKPSRTSSKDFARSLTGRCSEFNRSASLK